MSASAVPNDRGVTWSESRSGKIRIALAHEPLPGNGRWGWRVWGIYTGTHDLAPIARNFRTEAEARAYANTIWRTR